MIVTHIHKMDAKHCNCTSHIDWNTMPHDQWPVLADYEEMPEPKPVPEPTAEEAQKAVWEFMVDLYEAADEIAIQYVITAGYIIKSTEAQKFIVAQPQIAQSLRKYTDDLLRTQPSIIGILFDMSSLLSRLGF